MGVTVAVVVLSRAQLPDMGPSLQADGNILSGSHGPYQIAIALSEGQSLGDPENRAQLLVTLRSDVPAMQRAEAMVGLLASVVERTPARAVIWQASGVAVPADTFLQLFPLLREGPLTSLWVSFAMQEGSGRTIGLADFDLMELEVVDCPLGFQEAEAYLFGLAEYLLTQGPVVKDGDSLGEDELGKVRVVYSPSAFDQGKQVMRLVWQ